MTDRARAAERSYREAILAEAPRVLGLMDREPLSPTRGCLDRTFWAWKFVDFSGARFQEGLCVLSFLQTTPLEGSRYHDNARLLDWIAAGFDFWSSIQYGGGDFDEAYPFEHSLAATAFTMFYLSEAYALVGDRLPAATRDRFRASLDRAAAWMEKNDETHGFLSNHLAAAAAALYHAYRILEEDRYETRSRYFLRKILDHQSEEGWYEEYGGADPGYQSHGSFYLARYQELSGDDELAASLDRSLEWLAHFIHPDGSLGGEYASRNTQFYYPAAFEMCSARSGSATWIAESMQDSIDSLAAPGLGSMDAYNYYPLLNNYVFAHRACRREAHRAAEARPPADRPVVDFPAAGIVKRRTESYELIVGLRKGGAFKIFDRRTGDLACSDCGYLGRLKSGRLVSSQSDDADRAVEHTDETLSLKTGFFAFKKPVMSPITFMGFRGFSLTLGRIPQAAYWLKALLVKVLIYKRQSIELQLERVFHLTPAGVRIEDRVVGPGGSQLQSLERADVFTTIHMGSSRYFVPHELRTGARVPVDVSQLSDGVSLTRDVRFD